MIHLNFSKPFILTTDASDNAVGFTLCQEVEGELLPVRWIEYLESMNVKIFYLPGKEKIVSDFISRNISEEKAWNAIDVGIADLEFNHYNVGELLEEQLYDIEIRSVINYLENKDLLGKSQNVTRNT